MKDNQNDQTVQNNQKGQQNQTNPTSNQSGKIHEFENENLKKQSDLEIEQPNKEEKEIHLLIQKCKKIKYNRTKK